MAMIWDLGNKDMKRFQTILDLYKSKRGNVSAPEQSKLIEAFKDFGEDILRDAVVQCCLCNWHYVPMVRRVCGFYKEFGKERVETAIERLQGRQNHSQDMLEKILRDPSLARREVKPTHGPAPRKTAISYPTVDGIYDRYSAQLWLMQKNISINSALEYFENAGFTPDTNVPLLRLKSEYR